jgi:hypothetical protein
VPLNPPSFNGQDVYYSKDVYVNGVLVALTNAPALSGGAADGGVSAQDASFMQSDDNFNPNLNPNSSAELQAFYQQQIAAGNMTAADLAAINGLPSSGFSVDNSPPGSAKVSTPAEVSDILALTSFPNSLQLTPNYNLGQVSSYTPAGGHTIPSSGEAGYTQAQLVANLKFTLLNCIEPLKAQYPSQFVTSGWRPYSGNPSSQHPKGQAIDNQFRGVPFGNYYDIAVWMKQNVPYDQLIIEGRYPTSLWIHISCTSSPRRQAFSMINDATCAQGLIDVAAKMGISNLSR